MYFEPFVFFEPEVKRVAEVAPLNPHQRHLRVRAISFVHLCDGPTTTECEPLQGLAITVPVSISGFEAFSVHEEAELGVCPNRRTNGTPSCSCPEVIRLPDIVAVGFYGAWVGMVATTEDGEKLSFSRNLSTCKEMLFFNPLKTARFSNLHIAAGKRKMDCVALLKKKVENANLGTMQQLVDEFTFPKNTDGLLDLEQLCDVVKKLKPLRQWKEERKKQQENRKKRSENTGEPPQTPPQKHARINRNDETHQHETENPAATNKNASPKSKDPANLNRGGSAPGTGGTTTSAKPPAPRGGFSGIMSLKKSSEKPHDKTSENVNRVPLSQLAALAKPSPAAPASGRRESQRDPANEIDRRLAEYAAIRERIEREHPTKPGTSLQLEGPEPPYPPPPPQGNQPQETKWCSYYPIRRLELRKGWTSGVDRKSFRAFYIDTNKMVTTWARPAMTWAR